MSLLTAFDPPVRPPVLPESDVSYAMCDTAVGTLLLAVTAAGRLVASRYVPDAAAQDAWLARLASRVSPRVLRHPRPLDNVRRELDAYLAGRRRSFDVPLDLTLATGFQREVLTGLGGTGYGSTTTYGQLAAQIGHPRASRAVGRALGGNPLCILIPCHRVLPGSGGVGGYAGGAAAKELLLALEAGRDGQGGATGLT